MAPEAAAENGGLSGAVLDIDLDGCGVGPVADRLAAIGVPFLFATGWVVNGSLLGGHAAAPVLQKPFDTRELVAAVAALTQGGRRTHTPQEGTP